MPWISHEVYTIPSSISSKTTPSPPFPPHTQTNTTTTTANRSIRLAHVNTAWFPHLIVSVELFISSAAGDLTDGLRSGACHTNLATNSFHSRADSQRSSRQIATTKATRDLGDDGLMILPFAVFFLFFSFFFFVRPPNCRQTKVCVYIYKIHFVEPMINWKERPSGQAIPSAPLTSFPPTSPLLPIFLIHFISIGRRWKDSESTAGFNCFSLTDS